MVSNESFASNGNGVNGAVAQRYPPGIHVPSLTFFKDTSKQEIDWEVQERHLEFLVGSGVHGVVIAGTNGEAITLSTEEKVELVQRTKKIAQKLGREEFCITLGCTGGYTYQVIEQAKRAKDAGADFVLILVPSFFHFAIDQEAIISFFQEVADASPVPVIIYNFPNVVAGLDVDTEMLKVLGQHKNIAGVKFTCGSIAKVSAVAEFFIPQEFSALAGQSDWLIPALIVGGMGCITGIGNLYPKACLELYNLFVSGKVQAAADLQKRFAVGERAFAKAGINGTKWLVAQERGYPESSSYCRRPQTKFLNSEKRDFVLKSAKILEQIEVQASKQ